MKNLIELKKEIDEKLSECQTANMNLSCASQQDDEYLEMMFQDELDFAERDFFELAHDFLNVAISALSHGTSDADVFEYTFTKPVFINDYEKILGDKKQVKSFSVLGSEGVIWFTYSDGSEHDDESFYPETLSSLCDAVYDELIANGIDLAAHFSVSNEDAGEVLDTITA